MTKGNNVNSADSLYRVSKEEYYLGNYKDAEENTSKAINCSFLNHDTSGMVKAMVLLAELYYLNDSFESLEKLFSTLDKKYEKYLTKALEAEILLVKASYYRYIGDISDYNLHFNELKAIKGDIETSDAFNLKYYRQLANYYLFNTEEFSRAIEMFDSAMIYIEKMGNMPMESFKCHWCLGQALTRQKQYIHAEEHLSKCEEIYGENPQMLKIHIAYIYSFKMEVYGSLNNEKMMVIYFERLKDIYVQYKDSIQAPMELSKFKLNFVLAYINMSDYYFNNSGENDAISLLVDASEVFKGSPYHMQYVYDKMAWIYFDIGNMNHAKNIAKKLMAMQKKLDGKNNKELFNTYMLLSQIALENKNYNDANMFLNLSLDLPGISSKKKVRALYFKAKYYNLLGDNQKALAFFKESMFLNTGTVHVDSIFLFYSPENIADNEMLIRTFNGMAKAYHEIEKDSGESIKYQRIVKCFQYGILLVDKYLFYLDSEFEMESMINLKELNIKDYLIYLSALYEKNNDPWCLSEMFRFIEKSKATNLYLNLAENQAQRFANIPVNLLQEENRINNEIARVYTNYQKEHNAYEPDQEKIEQISMELSTLRNKKLNLIKQFENDYAEYFNLKYNPYYLELQTTVENISNHQALIQYYLKDDLLVMLLITKQDVLYSKISIGQDFYKTVEDVKAFVSNGVYSFRDETGYFKYLNDSHFLYEQLLGPFKGSIGDMQLIIVPDGKLSTLPFDALLDTLPISRVPFDFKNLPYLIKSNALGYAYSVSVLFSKKLMDNRVHNVLAFAPVRYPDKNISNDLYYIEGAEKEVKAIAGIFPTKLYLRDRASEKRFVQNANAKSIVHLATHTVVDENDPLNTRLVFHPEDYLKGSDGVLYSHEIYNLVMKAPLVVLSSCQSGSGGSISGEGAKSLAWAFKYAGIPSVVMTLWDVSDNVGVEIMKGFYKGLKLNLDKPEALQKAKVDYLKKADPLKTHPYYWASYNLIGNTSSLELQHKQSHRYLVFILVYVIAFLFMVIRENNKKQ